MLRLGRAARVGPFESWPSGRPHRERHRRAAHLHRGDTLVRPVASREEPGRPPHVGALLRHQLASRTLPVREQYFHQAQLMRLDDLASPPGAELLSTRLWRRYGAEALGLLESTRREFR
jgi:hypothetical protein